MQKQSLRDVGDHEVRVAASVLETMVSEPVYRGVPEGQTPADVIRRLDRQAAQFELLQRLRAELNRRKEKQ